MGAAEMKAGHEEEYVDGTSAAPWPQLVGVRTKTSPSLVDDRKSEDGEGRGGTKSNRTYRKPPSLFQMVHRAVIFAIAQLSCLNHDLYTEDS